MYFALRVKGKFLVCGLGDICGSVLPSSKSGWNTKRNRSKPLLQRKSKPRLSAKPIWVFCKTLGDESYREPHPPKILNLRGDNTTFPPFPERRKVISPKKLTPRNSVNRPPGALQIAQPRCEICGRIGTFSMNLQNLQTGQEFTCHLCEQHARHWFRHGSTMRCAVQEGGRR